MVNPIVRSMIRFTDVTVGFSLFLVHIAERAIAEDAVA